MDNPLLTSNKTKKLIKEGRGQGEGKHYQPWTKTYSREFSSKGRATRIFGVKTDRIHHLQSDNQYRAFLTFEYAKHVIDIREAYPLIDIYEVLNPVDINDLRFDKFCDRETKEPYVLTTNFLLTVQTEGGNKLVARTIKNVSELNRKITLEKLEIERRYWQARGIEWKVVTNKELSKQRAKNIEWVRETLLNDQLKENSNGLSESLLQMLIPNQQSSVRKILNTFDKTEMIEPGTALYLFRYLLATHQLEINMDVPINLSNTLEEMF